jgi:hypothetical protein
VKWIKTPLLTGDKEEALIFLLYFLPENSYLNSKYNFG